MAKQTKTTNNMNLKVLFILGVMLLIGGAIIYYQRGYNSAPGVNETAEVETGVEGPVIDSSKISPEEKEVLNNPAPNPPAGTLPE